MPDSFSNSLKRVGGVVGALAAIMALAGAWAILPHRLNAAEKRLDLLETDNRRHGEALVRIETKLDWLIQERKAPK